MEPAPDLGVEHVALESLAVRPREPGVQRVRKELVGARHRDQHFRRDAAEADLGAGDEPHHRGHGAEVRRAEQDQATDLPRAGLRAGKVVAVEQVDRAVARVVARDQPAVRVRDDVDLEVRIPVIAADPLDELVEPADAVHVVPAPVVEQHVVLLAAVAGRRAGQAGRVAAGFRERADDRAALIVLVHADYE